MSSSGSIPIAGGKIQAVLGEELRSVIETLEKAFLDPENRKIQRASTVLHRGVRCYRTGFVETFVYVLRVGDERHRPIARVELRIVVDGRYV